MNPHYAVLLVFVMLVLLICSGKIDDLRQRYQARKYRRALADEQADLLQPQVPCPACSTTCYRCGGRGEHQCQFQLCGGRGYQEIASEPCPAPRCAKENPGVIKHDCPQCHGTRRIVTQRAACPSCHGNINPKVSDRFTAQVCSVCHGAKCISTGLKDGAREPMPGQPQPAYCSRCNGRTTVPMRRADPRTGRGDRRGRRAMA